MLSFIYRLLHNDYIKLHAKFHYILLHMLFIIIIYMLTGSHNIIKLLFLYYSYI